MKARLFTLVAVLFVATTAMAQTPIPNSNLTWTLENDTLTIAGTDTMPNFPWNLAPWDSKRTSIKIIVIEDGVETIGYGAFSSCTDLTSVSISNSVTTIGSFAFQNCIGLTSVSIPNSITTIGNGAFSGCSSLTEFKVEIGNPSYKTVEGILFTIDLDTLVQYPASSGSSYGIPNSVTTIGSYAFYKCRGLESVSIPNSVTTIGDNAFNGCSGLTSVTIGNSVITIGNSAFLFCHNLTQIDVKATESPVLVGTNVFLGVRDTAWINVPCQSVESYRVAEGWSTFSNIVGSTLLSVMAESDNPQKGSVVVVEVLCEELTAIIEATANENHRFVQWQDGNTENPRTIALLEDNIFIAEFESTVGIVTATQQEEMIKIYPNPATNIIHIQSSVAVQNVVIYDINGRIEMQVENTSLVSIRHLPNGIYLVRIITANGTSIHKIVKE